MNELSVLALKLMTAKTCPHVLRLCFWCVSYVALHTFHSQCDHT